MDCDWAGDATDGDGGGGVFLTVGQKAFLTVASKALLNGIRPCVFWVCE